MLKFVVLLGHMKIKLILLSLAVIAVSGGAIYAKNQYADTAKKVALLPTAATADSRNQLRKLFLNQLTTALNNYIATNGTLPIKLSTVPKAICSTISVNCAKAKLVDLNFLSATGIYIQSIPSDPVGVHSEYSTGFMIAKDPATGKIVVTAPNAELGAVLSASTH
jgi:hypothetical protein